jgi:uncharacterized protein (TIGR03067 family)
MYRFVGCWVLVVTANIAWAGPEDNALRRGTEALNRGELDAAVAALTEALRLDPKAATALCYRGLAYKDKGLPDKALADFDEAVRLDPTRTLAWNGRGLVRRQLGQLDRALADLTEAIRLDPKFAAPYQNRALVHAAKGDFDRALGDINLSVRLDPLDPQSHAIRGTIHLSRGDPEKAAESLDQAIRLNPKYAMAYVERSRAYQRLKAFDKAAADLEAGVRLHPADAEALNELAWLLATCPDPRVRDGRRAVVHAKNACDLAKWADAGLIDTLAAAHAEAGQFDEAVTFGRKAVALAEKGPKDAREEFRAHLATFERHKTIAAGAPAGPATAGELQGRWRAVSVEVGGRTAAMNDTWEFQTDGTLTLRLAVSGSKPVAWKYEVDGKAGPKEVTFTDLGGKKIKGIWAIEQDALRICYVKPGLGDREQRPRPAAFETMKRDDVVLVTFERVK